MEVNQAQGEKRAKSSTEIIRPNAKSQSGPSERGSNGLWSPIMSDCLLISLFGTMNSTHKLIEQRPRGLQTEGKTSETNERSRQRIGSFGSLSRKQLEREREQMSGLEFQLEPDTHTSIFKSITQAKAKSWEQSDLGKSLGSTRSECQGGLLHQEGMATKGIDLYETFSSFCSSSFWNLNQSQTSGTKDCSTSRIFRWLLIVPSAIDQ